MKNNHGMTLASIIIILIVVIIIASVSIIAGNNLMVESKDQLSEQKIQTVRDAVMRRKTDVAMGGKYMPIGESYVGIVNPVIGQTEDGEEICAGSDWYLIEEKDLEGLGVTGDNNAYYVNYELGEVIPYNYSENIVEKIESYN